MRKCKHCGQEKNVHEFVKHKECVNGITRMCKECETEKRHNRIRTMHGRIMTILARIKSRCYSPHDNNFHRYGWRGIESSLTYEDLIKIW